MKELGTQTIETERLILRRFVETDAQAMFDNWASRSENLTYVTWNPHHQKGTTLPMMVLMSQV